MARIAEDHSHYTDGIVDPSSGRPIGGVLLRTIDLTADQVNALHDDPPVIVPAPGVGLMLIPVTAVLHLRAGTVPFPFDGEIDVWWANQDRDMESFGPLYGSTYSNGPFLAATEDKISIMASNAIYRGSVADQALLLVCRNGFVEQGPIVTSHLAGSNDDSQWAPGDLFTVQNGSGSGAAAGVIDTVDGNGQVLTYHLTSAGDHYLATDECSLSPVSPSTGLNGPGIIVDSINAHPRVPGNGTMTATVHYFIKDAT